MPTCTTCGVEKNISEFHWRKETNKPRSQCKACINHANLARYFTNPNTRLSHRRAARKFNLKKYRIDSQDFQKMHAAQEGRCAICCSPVGDLEANKQAFIDHCHATLKVRGLLCQPCNTGLGQFYDNPALLRAAADYVEHHANNSI